MRGSFYGNVFYEFGKLFNRFFFRNKGKDKEEIPTPEDDFSISALERWDTLSFNSGNKWIVLNQNSEGVDISHGAPGEIQTETGGFIPEEEGTEGTALSSGGAFSTYDLNFDKAGHLKDCKKNTYLLPSATIHLDDKNQDINLNDDNKFHFQGDNWINLNPEDQGKKLSFQHTTPFGEENLNGLKSLGIGYLGSITSEEFEPERVLEAGDYISTTEVVYDQAGHTIGLTEKVYQLPASQTETDISDIKERLDEAEENIKTIQTDYAPLTLTGEIKDLYNEDTEKYEYKTLTSTIGNIEEIRNAVLKAETDTEFQEFILQLKQKDFFNITESFQYLISRILQLEANATNASLAIKALSNDIEDLKERVENLTNQ